MTKEQQIEEKLEENESYQEALKLAQGLYDQRVYKVKTELLDALENVACRELKISKALAKRIHLRETLDEALMSGTEM